MTAGVGDLARRTVPDWRWLEKDHPEWGLWADITKAEVKAAGLDPAEVLHLGTAAAHGGGGLTAMEIATRFGCEVRLVNPLVPPPARSGFVLHGARARQTPTVRLTKEEQAQARRDARGYDVTPTVANSPVQTCALPANAKRMQARAEANGWHVEVLYGRAELAKRRKGEDAMEYYLLLVNSVSLRMGRGDEAAYAIWANGKWDGGGYKAGAEEIRGLGARETETRIG